MSFRLLDIFSGIGGFSLGLERTGGFKTQAFCEIDPFCRRVLKKHWPDVPCYEDVREISTRRLEADGIGVDVICGGFPCQPFSTASRGRRTATDLWPEMLRIIGDIRPKFVVGENVQQEAVAVAARNLSGIGFATDIRRIGAHDAGADHTRDRWWLCAYADTESKLRRSLNAEVAGLRKVCESLWGAANYRRAIRVPDGLPDRVDDALAIGALGNAVLPQIPELYGRAILASLSSCAPVVHQT